MPDRLAAQGNSQMTFADARRPLDQQCIAVGHPAASGQVAHLLAIERRLGCKVESLQRPPSATRAGFTRRRSGMSGSRRGWMGSRGRSAISAACRASCCSTTPVPWVKLHDAVTREAQSGAARAELHRTVARALTAWPTNYSLFRRSYLPWRRASSDARRDRCHKTWARAPKPRILTVCSKEFGMPPSH